MDRHYIGSITATLHQEKGIITLESNPSRGTVLPAPHGKGNKCDKNVKYKRTDALSLWQYSTTVEEWMFGWMLLNLGFRIEILELPILSFTCHITLCTSIFFSGRTISKEKCFNIRGTFEKFWILNITTQSVASPRSPHYSMMPIVTFNFDLGPPKSIGFILSPWLTCLSSSMNKYTTV